MKPNNRGVWVCQSLLQDLAITGKVTAGGSGRLLQSLLSVEVPYAYSGSG